MASLGIDTDALLMLLALNSFDDALSLLNLSRKDCFRLNAILYQLKKSRSQKRIRKNYPNLNFGWAMNEVSKIPTLPNPSNLALQDELNQVNGIDVGEVMLLSSAAENIEQIILSGDGRMLRAIGNEKNNPIILDAYEKLRKKIIYLPELIAGLTKDEAVGLTEMEKRWRESGCGHNTIYIMFTSQKATTESIDDGLLLAVSSVEEVLGSGFLLNL